MFTEPRKSSSGLFVVDWQDNFVHWLAWREWLHEAFGKVFFPQFLTVTFAWPPETGSGATSYAFWLQDIRQAVEKEPSVDGGGPCKPIPDIVLPWRGWSDALKADVAAAEAKRRQEWDRLFDHAPKYPWKVRQGWRMGSPVPNQTLAAVVERLRAGREAAE